LNNFLTLMLLFLLKLYTNLIIPIIQKIQVLKDTHHFPIKIFSFINFDSQFMFRFLWINHFHTYRKIKFIIFLMIAYNIKAQLKKFWIHYFNFSSNMLSHLAWCMGYHNLFTLYLKIIKFIYRRLYKVYIFLVHILFFY